MTALSNTPPRNRPQNSLAYASRVKVITNAAKKNDESKEIARLRAIIRKLKAGEAIDDDAEVEIPTATTPSEEDGASPEQ